MTDLARDLCDYVAASPSPYHCVAESLRRLEDAGFEQLDEGAPWPQLRPGARLCVVRDGTIFAWIMGTGAPVEHGVRLIGAHTDSPNLRLKPHAEYTSEGYAQWGVEVYGGVLLHTWLDRDLGLSGRVAVRTPEGVALRPLRIDRPIARVPNLAIHLNRKIRTDGLKLNEQKHLPPVLGVFENDAPDVLPGLVRDALHVDPADILGWDLMLHDVQPPVVGGVQEDFVFAPRMDNQASCHSALCALLALEQPPAATVGIVLFDHEEVGSRSAHGANSSWLKGGLQRTLDRAEAQAPGGYERMAANSYMVSADMAHGVHPNYADRHEGRHKPRINGGPVIKVNTNQRYASNAETAGRFKLACLESEVPVQEFVNRTDLACGSTIGPISAAALGIRSVDVGCAMLSMHSVREQAGARDVALMVKAMQRVLVS
jgi:aspartyl aminopeptidase